MPLIQCPDCLADMSTTAGKCQRCGSTTYQQKKLAPAVLFTVFAGLGMLLFLAWVLG